MKVFNNETNSPPGGIDCAAEMLETVPLLVRTMRAQMRSQGARDLSLVEFRTLAFVGRKDAATLSDLKDHIGLSLPSMSKIVNSLVQQNLMRRTTSSSDRRCMALSLTPRGRQLHTAARAQTQRYLAARLAALPARQRTEVAAAFRLLRVLFTNAGCCGRSRIGCETLSP